MLDGEPSDLIAGRAVVFECLEHTTGDKVDHESLALGGAGARVVLKTVLSVAKVVTLLVDVVFSDLVALRRLRKHQNGR